MLKMRRARATVTGKNDPGKGSNEMRDSRSASRTGLAGNSRTNSADGIHNAGDDKRCPYY